MIYEESHNKKLVMITAYDYPTAKIIDKIQVDYILVGDSLGMVILGNKDTKSVNMEIMIHHATAVIKGAPNSKIFVDMPINSYNSRTQALENANKFRDIGVYGIKVEGFVPNIISTLISNRIKVMGHLGLLPQTAKSYTVQGTDKVQADKLVMQAIELDKLGMEAIVLECIPTNLARDITGSIHTPTIGIGAGPYCSGQVLVLHDILGLSEFQGRMVKRFANIGENIRDAVQSYKNDVASGKFPDNEHSFD